MIALIVKRGEDVYFINGNHHTVLDVLFSWVTVLGEGVLFIPIFFYFLFVQFRYAALTFTLWASHSIVCQFIKRGLFNNVHRPIAVLDKSQLYFIPNIEVHGLYSFPSGHTATIFCLAMLMTLIIKKRVPAVIFLVIALLVGYSRIYLVQHFLIDVAGGAVIGVSLTYGVWKIFEHKNMAGWMNGPLIGRMPALNNSSSSTSR